MKVTENIHTGTLTIEGLTPGQFAYITALVGDGHALVNRAGRVGGSPVVADARGLYAPLAEAAEEHELDQLVRTVETAQRLWRERTTKTERKQVAA